MINRFAKHRHLVALSWDQGQVHTLLAAVRGTEIELIDVITLELDRELTPAEIGAQLGDQLRQHKVQSYKLLVGIPRSQVDLLQFQLPTASQMELPAMVRNEVIRRLSDLPEDALIDFLLLSNGAPDGCRVEAAVLRPETNSFLRDISTGLGRSPTQVVLRPLAIASLFDRLTGEDHVKSLLLNLVDADADMSILARGQVQFSRTVRLATDPSGEDRLERIVDEIRRTLAIAPLDPNDESEVQHVYLFGDLNQRSSFIERMAGALELPVSLLDPLVGIRLRASVDPCQVNRFTALIGIVRDFVEGQPPIDFANPKQPPEAPRYGRKIAVYATATSLVLAALGWHLRSELDDAQSQLREVARQLEQETQMLEKLRTRTVAVDAVDRWRAGDIHWLDELQELSQKFPAADEAVLQTITMSSASGGLGVLSMSVRAKEPSMIGELESSLRDEFHQVTSRRISQATDPQKFPCQFETSVNIRPRPRTDDAAEQRPIASTASK